MIVYTVMYMVHLSAAHSCDSRAPNLVMFFVCTLWVKKPRLVIFLNISNKYGLVLISFGTEIIP